MARPRKTYAITLSVALTALLVVFTPGTGRADSLPGSSCTVLPADNVWHADVSHLPVDPNSATYIASIGATAPLHPDFGAGNYGGGPIGIPYNVAPSTQMFVPVHFTYASESDPGPYPIPRKPLIEGGPHSTGDRHVLVVDSGSCTDYELFSARPRHGGRSWHAGSGAVFPLGSDSLRTAGWTSADAAGLPILPGLVRPDEVAAGVIDHAIRVTVPESDDTYIWPARHEAGTADPSLPPMGLRLRLKTTVDISQFPPMDQVILQALKTYGMIVADNGSPWFISGVPSSYWDNTTLHALTQITGSDFEVVDESCLMVSPDSGATDPGDCPPAS
ncbi:MAG TPA: hypothetical protein VN796_05530 [Acidimicrobiales bacterium]|nr:hypothetical protein [Acidimicrobiales bacterium]